MNVEPRENGTEEAFLLLFFFCRAGEEMQTEVEKGHVNTVGGG